MWWATGDGLSAAATVLSGRAHETVRPTRTVAAAAAVTSGVIRLSAPSWSSSPQRPQLVRLSWRGRTSSAAMGSRGTVRTVVPGQYDRPMTTLQGDYEPSPSQWVRDQVAEYESSGGQRGNMLGNTEMPVIIVTMRGRVSGKVRKL